VQITISDDHRPTVSTLKALNEHGITFGAQVPGGIHLTGVIFVVDKYCNPLMTKRQTVDGDVKKDSAADAAVRAAWNAPDLPQYRLIVTCREHAPNDHVAKK
jgi:hypothetical protein